LANKLVDVNFSVAKITTLHIVPELPCPPSTSGVGELERPKEIRGLLEVGTGSDNLMHEILDAKDVVLAEVLLDDGIVGERDALFVDLAVAAFVDQLADGLEVRFTICDIGFNKTQHLLSSPCGLDENAIVDLQKSQQLQDFSGFGGNLVDTSDTDDEIHFWLSGNIEITSSPCNSLQADLFPFLCQIFLHIRLSTLENDFSLCFCSLDNKVSRIAHPKYRTPKINK